mgnify:CR=1 FL=1
MHHLLIILAIFFSLNSPELSASTSVGSIKTLSGEVKVSRGGELLPSNMGMPILKNDELITGKNSAVGIIMHDNTVLTAGEDSSLSVESFTYDRKSRRGSLRTNLRKGSLSSISGHLAKTSPDSVRFKTATMTLGVRGTEFIIEVNDNDEVDTSIILLEEPDGSVGKIDIETPSGNVETVDTAFTQVDVDQKGELKTSLLSSLDVFARFCGLFDAQPSRPKTYVFYFDDLGDLTKPSEEMLEALTSDIRLRGYPDIEVVGYTDNSYDDKQADDISSYLADNLYSLLKNDISEESINIVARGAFDLLISKSNEYFEPLNNRVEVTLK